MKELIGKRIQSARKLSGLSLRELADRMSGFVSHNAISKYEKAEMMPDSKVLVALSHALNVKSDYFFRPYTVEIENIEFRKKSKLASKKVFAIKEDVTNTIERYIELEQFLNFTYSFQNPIKDRVIKDGDDVENAVNYLLDQWKLGFNVLSNVIELLEDKEIKVIELDAQDEFDGLSGWASNDIPVIVVNKTFPVERKRFTALHELGHLLLNFDVSLEEKEIERLCHRFAGAFLMPKETFIKEIGTSRKSISISELVNLKESYGISMQAIMARAKNLKVINDDYYITFRKWVNKHEDHKKEIGFGSFKGSEGSTRFKQLLYRATAEEIISMSKAANLANQKLATYRDEYIAI
jgi:Zn-dependent peptidase ImmA (M78 family)